MLTKKICLPKFLKFRPTEAMRIWQDLPGQFSCSFLEFSQEGLEEHEAEPKAGDIKG